MCEKAHKTYPSTSPAYTMRTSVPGRLERISESNRYAPPIAFMYVCTWMPFVRHKLVSFAAIPECHGVSSPWALDSFLHGGRP
jgi:hypothetical protein